MFKRLNSKKAIQAIGVLLLAEQPSIMDKSRILKLLYIADRESIRDTGRPLLGSRIVAMDRGPLHSSVLDLINGQHIDEPIFSRHFSNRGYRVVLNNDPGRSELSRNEINKLQEVSARYEEYNTWQLVEMTHKLPEFEKRYVEDTSTDILIDDVIEAVGRGDDKDAILQDLKDSTIADNVFGRS